MFFGAVPGRDCLARTIAISAARIRDMMMIKTTRKRVKRVTVVGFIVILEIDSIK
jgi:hypothetical protein